MDKLRMATKNLADEKYKKLVALFPNAVNESVKGYDDNGNAIVERAIDIDIITKEISCICAEGKEERYQFTWPDKKKAILLANSPIAKTLRPYKTESIDFETTENLYIEGDNLDVLKLLHETYLEKIKLIYIDPPYNTGNDFVYEDNFAENSNEYISRSGQVDEQGNRLVENTESNGRFHTDWLNMIYPRLQIAKDLLSDDGVIFISIDDNEVVNLRKVCDEIFGASNFIDTLIWEKRYSPQNAVQWFSENHDYIVVYAKNKMRWQPQLLERTDQMNARYKNIDNDPRGPWKASDSTAQGGHGTKSQFYVLTAPNGKEHHLPSGLCWRYTENAMQKLIEDNRVWFGNDGNNVPAIKKFLSEVKQGVACQTIWKYEEVGHSQEGKKEIISLFPEGTPFETPKPIRLIEKIIRIAASRNEDFITLDFFSGSATAAHALMKLNASDGGHRKFIMVQLPEICTEDSEAYKAGYVNICEIGKERIRRAGKIIKEEVKLIYPHIDIGFRVLKCDSTNMKDVYYRPSEYELTLFSNLTNNIKENRTTEDLLFQVMLDLGILLSSKIEEIEIERKKVYKVADGFLVACFDTDISDKIVKSVAQMKPYYAVFRDSCMANDSAATNFEQIFLSFSPDTVRKVL